MRYIDLFAGIGGFRSGFNSEGFNCVFSSEYDPTAKTQWKQIAYELLYGEKPAGDITKFNAKEIPDHDVLCGGFPCQAFSVSGNQKGFEDTRGTLFFHIKRIAKEKQPRLLVLENVKGLLSHEKGETFFTILKALDEIGYDAEWRVLNAKDFGLPQNRERTIIIGHSRRGPLREIFPVRRESAKNDCKVAGNLNYYGNDQMNRVYDPAGLSPTITVKSDGGREQKIVHPVLKNHGKLKVQESGIANCIDANYHKGIDNHGQRTHIRSCSMRTRSYAGQPQQLEVRKDELSNTVTTVTKDSLVYDPPRIRKLTPLECFRLQGFSDEQFYKLREAGIADTHLYKMAGDAAPVNMTKAIAARIKEVYGL